MKKNKFKIEYDMQPNEIVDEISESLSIFNLEIIECDGGDGWVKYEIIEKIK